jgi:hypothetical protein
VILCSKTKDRYTTQNRNGNLKSEDEDKLFYTHKDCQLFVKFI